MNSWQDERDQRQRAPQIPAHVAIINLEGALKDGQALANNNSVSRDKLDVWEATTEHMLEMALGKGEQADSFKQAGPSPQPRRPGPNTDALRLRERNAKHRAQLTKLQGLIAILKQTPESPAALLAPEGHAPTATKTANIDVFISHSARDETLAGALAHLLRTAFRLSSKRIRCTSVDGHTLPAGANVAEALRQDIETAPVFLAVMTESSSESEYVLAEIGARWMTRRYAVMLVAGGYARSDTPGPLKDTHALRLSSEADLLKLVTEVAEQLAIEPEGADSLHRLVKELATMASTQRATVAAQPSQPQPEPELSTELVKVLERFVTREDKNMGAPTVREIASGLQLQVSDVKERLARLVDAKMLEVDGYALSAQHRLSRAGRAYILRLRAPRQPDE